MSALLARLAWLLAWLALSAAVVLGGWWLAHQIDPWLAVYLMALTWYATQRAYFETLAQHQEYVMTGGLVLPWWRRRHRYEGRW